MQEPVHPLSPEEAAFMAWASSIARMAYGNLHRSTADIEAWIDSLHQPEVVTVEHIARLMAILYKNQPRYTSVEEMPSHLSTCGTLYRGCAPACPKERWEQQHQGEAYDETV